MIFQDSGSRQIVEITRTATHVASNAALTVDAHRHIDGSSGFTADEEIAPFPIGTSVS